MPQIEVCQNHIKTVLTAIYQTPPEDRTNNTLFQRDILVYTYLLKHIGQPISIANLTKYIGPSMQNTIKGHVDTTLKTFQFIRGNDSALELAPEMISAIETVLGNENYRLNHPVPGMQGLTGWDFIAGMCQLRLLALDPSHLIYQSLRALLPSLQMEVRGSYVVYSLQGQHYYIYATTNDGALTHASAGTLIMKIASQIGVGKKTLIIAPDSEDVQIFRNLVDFPYIYHAWPISWVYFMHKLQEAVNRYGDLSNVFDELFPPEERAPFSGSAAVERIEKKKQS